MENGRLLNGMASCGVCPFLWIPACAGMTSSGGHCAGNPTWIPACAGMTENDVAAHLMRRPISVAFRVSGTDQGTLSLEGGTRMAFRVRGNDKAWNGTPGNTTPGFSRVRA